VGVGDHGAGLDVTAAVATLTADADDGGADLVGGLAGGLVAVGWKTWVLFGSLVTCNGKD
jgi:hypothetical protein